MRQHEERLRRLAINDGPYLERITCPHSETQTSGALDGRERALIQLSALVAIGGPASAFEWTTSQALANGATADDMVDVLVVTASLVGSAHVVAAAPKLARALGYDLDTDLERPPVVANR